MDRAMRCYIPKEVTARYIREYVAELVSSGKKDTTVWDHAHWTDRANWDRRHAARDALNVAVLPDVPACAPFPCKTWEAGKI